LDEIVEINKGLIDENLQVRQFNLYLKYESSKLMNFIKKTGNYPDGAEQMCEKNELYVEQAFIILDKAKKLND
jgi:hypothetical protein